MDVGLGRPVFIRAGIVVVPMKNGPANRAGSR
jgi:hypothetical protein